MKMNGLRLMNSFRNVLICFCVPAASLFAQAGSLVGSITDVGNKPVAGALVIASRKTLPVGTGRATSAADGTFQVSALQAGSYTVCVRVPGSDFLDTCEWYVLPLQVDVKAGQAVTGLKFKLQRGAILQIRLNDPANILAPAVSTATAKTVPSVLMGIQTTKGLFRPVALVSKDATGTTHAVTVPFDTALNFTVLSPNASLADAKGAPLTAPVGQGGFNVPVKIASGTSPAPLTFNVTGLK
jgi:hypothetical protein